MPYVRPPLPRQVFVDADGTRFEYGQNRWGMDGPPEDRYSVDSHPERFAALHDVADALVEHLVATYDVARSDDVDPASLLPQSRAIGFERTVRLVPADPDAAPMTFLWTDYPGVMVEAGVLLHAHVPGCGCDACDSSVADEARELEEIALGVPEGRLREWVRRALPGGATWIGHALETPDRVSSSDGRANLPRDVVRAARRRLAALPDGVWRPWPRR